VAAGVAVAAGVHAVRTIAARRKILIRKIERFILLSIFG
jgi:hypothetical protein